MPRTRVHCGANGQFKTTVPKGLAEAVNLNGKRLEWESKSGSTLKVTVTDD